MRLSIQGSAVAAGLLWGGALLFVGLMNLKAREAAEIGWTVGKRLCDAHEWEGACAGALEPPDYRFDLAKGVSPEEGIRRMRSAHNQADSDTKSWSYGPTYQKGICATGSKKTPGCNGGSWTGCGVQHLSHGLFPRVP